MATVSVPKKLERLERENIELRQAVRAIVTGEFALRNGKTRTFRDYLKARYISRNGKSK